MLSHQVDPPNLVAISDNNDAESESVPTVQLEIHEQNIVCCLYDVFPWIGMVDEISEEVGDYYIISCTLMDLPSNSIAIGN